MAMAFQVNGEAKLTGGTGAAAALEDIGVSTDGITVELTEHSEPVYTDSFGPGVTFDEQFFLIDAKISADLEFWDETIFAKWRTKLGGGATEGTMAQAGALWGQGGYYLRLLVQSPSVALPWNFPKSRLLDSYKLKAGTRRGKWSVTWKAVPYTGTAGVTTSAVLYNRTSS